MRDYEYIGMGSIYFVDYSMLHRHLGIENLKSAEIDKAVFGRAKFNRPFANIEVVNEAVNVLIESADARRRKIIWLDYDYQIHARHCLDLILAAQRAPSGSIIVCTFDCAWPKIAENLPGVRDYYMDQVGAFIDGNAPLAQFDVDEVHALCARCAERAIWKGLEGRGLQFVPLYYFTYADGHKMVSVGGMVADEADFDMISNSPLLEQSYIRQDFGDSPFDIVVPNITRKERHYLDANMPCRDDYRPVDFDLSARDIAAYRAIYRFLPSYSESYL
jgi:hypothetical protein